MFWRRRQRDIDYDDFYRDDRDREFARAKPARIWPHLILLLIFAACTLATVRVTAGEPMFWAMLKALATPCGVLWCGLLVTAYVVTLRRQFFAALLAWGCWAVLSICGNSYIATEIVRPLEAPFEEIELEELEPFDVVLVLGGATSTNPAGNAQLSGSGDRLMTAIRLHHLGKVKKFVCTGTRWQGIFGNERDIHEEAESILSGAGVPEQEIVQLSAGENTKEELEVFQEWLQANSASRIGVISSAWHLPRVQRLADAKGLELVAVPCDFLTKRFKPDPHLLIPSAGNLKTVSLALKEYLAERIGQ